MHHMAGIVTAHDGLILCMCITGCGEWQGLSGARASVQSLAQQLPHCRVLTTLHLDAFCACLPSWMAGSRVLMCYREVVCS